MDHIIQEIDDDLKRERLQNLWQNFGSHIVALSIVVLLGTAGLVGWKEFHHARNQAATDVLVSTRELIESKKYDKAREKLEAALPDMHGSLKLIGQLWLAQLYHNDGKRDRADEIYAHVRDQQDEPELAAYANLLHSKSDEKFLSATAFSSLSKEKQGLTLLKAGKRVEAASLFKALEEDVMTPSSMRTRINLILMTLEPEIEQLEKAAVKQEASKPLTEKEAKERTLNAPIPETQHAKP